MVVAAAHLFAGQGGGSRGGAPSILINKSMPAPAWAVAEREMLQAAADGTSCGSNATCVPMRR
jgi:hypothetical protein